MRKDKNYVTWEQLICLLFYLLLLVGLFYAVHGAWSTIIESNYASGCFDGCIRANKYFVFEKNNHNHLDFDCVDYCWR